MVHVCVMRHADRADTDWADSWSTSADAQKWPVDTPLSDVGRARAKARLDLRGQSDALSCSVAVLLARNYVNSRNITVKVRKCPVKLLCSNANVRA